MPGPTEFVESITRRLRDVTVQASRTRATRDPEPNGRDPDPHGGFRFLVEVDSLLVGGFSKVSGVELQIDTEPYEEGGRNDYVHTLPGRARYTNIVLERGLTNSPVLWEWAKNAARGTVERKVVRIVVLDTTGRESRAWVCTGAYPVRWTGPQLDANRGETVAIETLELAHKGLEEMPVGDVTSQSGSGPQEAHR